MRRRSATRGNVHINNAEAAIGLLAGHRDGVSIAEDRCEGGFQAASA